MGVPISSFTFENVDYEIKDAVARDAMASLNGFKYSICSTTENTPSGVSFTDSDTGFTVTGALAASSSTKNMIYLVPANGGEAKNVYEEYITVELTKTVDNAETTVYQWEKIGSTAIDLNGYLTTDDAARFAPKTAPVFTGSISMGRKTNSEIGTNSVAAGENVSAIGYDSHAEGRSATAIGPESHAEGSGTTTQGIGSHAEGMGSTANANYSHAEGRETVADGEYSHAEGLGTIARGRYEHVSGKYNIPDSAPAWEANTRYNIGDIVSYRELGAVVDKIYRCNTANSDSSFDDEKWSMYSPYLFMIGNGTDNANRSNALTVDIDGNAVFAGKATVGAAPVNDMDVATKKYVDDNVGGGSSVDTSTLAPKADPAFTGSISMGRDANSTAGANSVATGVNVAAEGNQSHAEGMMTKAVGENSHAEGTWTNASGGNSHAEGLYTTALGKSEHVSGQFNVLDTATAWVAGTSYNVGDVVSRVENGVTKIYRCKTANSNASWSSSNWEEYGQYLFVVGNGTDGNNRSNAFSVDWDGNTKTSGKMVVGKYNEVIDVNTIAGWSGGTSYNVGDLVSYVPGPGGAVAYRCILSFSDNPGGSTTPPAYDSSHWQYVNGTAPLFAVGNGTDEQHRANAFAVDEYGNAVFAGKATVGTAPQGAMDVTTKEYVDSEIRKKDIHEYPPVYLTIGTDDLEHSIWNGTDYRPGTLANGRNNRVEAHYAHAEGVGSHAIYPGELATGKYNIIETYDAWDTSKAYEIGDIITHPDPDEPYAWTNIYRCVAHQNAGSFDFANWELYSKYLLVVGNGIEDAHRSNAATIDLDGNAVFAGKATVGAAPVNDMDVATKKYVDDNAGGGSSSDNPVFTGSISMGRVEGSTVGQNSVAIGEGVIAANDGEIVLGKYNIILDKTTIPAWVDGNGYAVGDYVTASIPAPGGPGIFRCVQAIAAGSDASHAQPPYTGNYWVGSNSETVIFTVGNGTDDQLRSDAFTVNKYGNAVFAGKATVGRAPQDDMDVATKKYVDDNAGSNIDTSIFATKAHPQFTGGISMGRNMADMTIPFGANSVALGNNVVASGANSVALGDNVIASGDGEIALGKYNDTGSAPAWEANHQYKFEEVVSRVEDGKTVFYKCTYPNSDSEFDSNKWSRQGYSLYIFSIGDGISNSHKNVFSINYQRGVSEGYKNVASGAYSHAEGQQTVASGLYSHAEGGNTIAEYQVSHAEGSNTEARGQASHAEGSATKTYGYAAHAEGMSTIARGEGSHAEGIGTSALGKSEHVSGQFNILYNAPAWESGKRYVKGDVVSYTENGVTKIYRCISSSDTNTTFIKYPAWQEGGQYLFAIGNGTDDEHRSNASTIDWDGNAVFAGKATVGAAPVNDMDVATKKYVDDNTGYMPKDINVEVVDIGYSNNVTRGNYGILVNGIDNEVNGNSNIISGQGLNVRGSYKTVIGKYNVAPETYPELEIGYEYHVGDIVIAPDSDGGSTVYRCKETYTYVDEYDDGIYYGILDGSPKWEVYDDGHIFTIGNGANNANRSNAFTVDTNGNATAQTSITIGNTTINEAQLQALLALLNTQNANGQSF